MKHELEFLPVAAMGKNMSGRGNLGADLGKGEGLRDSGKTWAQVTLL